MKLATREQIAEIDNIAKEQLKLTCSQLEEKAGLALANGIESAAAEFSVKKSDRVGIWCGPGSNGNDGRIVARILRERGFRHIEILEGCNWPLDDFNVLIDAYFGVGLNRDLEESVKSKVLEINAAAGLKLVNRHTPLKILAVDMPTGLCANTGEIRGASVRATGTFTIYPPKPGLFLNDGPASTGRLFSVSLGLPASVYTQPGLLNTFLVDRKMAGRLLPPRNTRSNKTSFGHLLVVAGSVGMEGAASLVCEAAARMGCGYVTLCSRSPGIQSMVKPDFLHLEMKEFFQHDLKKYSAVVIGPGLGRDLKSWKMVQHLLQHHSRVLVDADGLSLLSEHLHVALPASWILTPHAGELSRLTQIPARELEADRLRAVLQAQKQWNAVILFKGFRTVLRNQAQAFVIYSGNVALAKAGSGDVLAGFIGSLMAQGMNTAEAGALGAYLHGRIADDWLRRGKDSRTLMASDLPLLLDATLSRLKKPR